MYSARLHSSFRWTDTGPEVIENEISMQPQTSDILRLIINYKVEISPSRWTLGIYNELRTNSITRSQAASAVSQWGAGLMCLDGWPYDETANTIVQDSFQGTRCLSCMPVSRTTSGIPSNKRLKTPQGSPRPPALKACLLCIRT